MCVTSIAHYSSKLTGVVMPIFSLKKSAIALTALVLGSCAHTGIDPPRTACSLKELPTRDRLVQVPFEVVDGRVYVSAKVYGKGLSGSR